VFDVSHCPGCALVVTRAPTPWTLAAGALSSEPVHDREPDTTGDVRSKVCSRHRAVTASIIRALSAGLE
jgi:hypothetical protein